MNTDASVIVPVDKLLVAAKDAISQMEARYEKLARLNASNRIGDALPFARDNYNTAFETAGAACIAYVQSIAAAPAQAAPEGVLPERMLAPEGGDQRQYAWDCGWNACLDQIEANRTATRPSSDGLSAGEREALVEEVAQIQAGDTAWPGDYDARAQWIRRERAGRTIDLLLRRLSGAVSVDGGMVERACDAYAYAQFDAIGYHGDEVVSAYMHAALVAALQAPAP